MRAHRRGTKEMDLILGAFASARLVVMEPTELDRFDTLLEENDQDLYTWVTGQVKTPSEFADLICEIANHAGLSR